MTDPTSPQAEASTALRDDLTDAIGSALVAKGPGMAIGVGVFEYVADALIAGPLATLLARATAAEAERDEARATNRDLHRRAQKAEAFKARHRNSFDYVLNRRREDRFARRRAEATVRERDAEIERLREALKPFAEAADNLEGDEHDTRHLWESPEAMMLTACNLRAARASLAPPHPQAESSEEATGAA